MEAPAQGGSSFKARAVAQASGGSPKSHEAQLALPPQPKDEEGQGERLVELHASFRELFTFFCTNATIHGAIRLVCSSRNRLKTASWGLLFLGALGALYWQFGVLFEQYWRYPVIMTVSVHSERKLFPSVTLCNMNPHRPSSVRHHLQALDQFAQENIRSLYKFNFSPDRDAPFADDPGPQPAFCLDRSVRLQRLSRPGGQSRVGFRLCNSTGGDCFYRAFSSGVAATREWYRFHYGSVLGLLPATHEDSHRSHGGHFVFSCQFDGQDCQARHFQTFHHPTYGSCYTFNGVWATQRPGIPHGISLVLRTEQQDHLPLLSSEAGIKVMIHERDHTPFLEHQGFSIRPGTETTIGIREDEVHRLGSPYSHCTHSVDGAGVQLLYNASYTLQVAWRHGVGGHCFYRLYRDLGTHRLPCASRCPRPCRESSYKLSAGTSRWPSSKSADWILAVLGKRGQGSSSQSLRSNMAKVNIFYQELNYRTVDETPIYSVPQLLSAMGSLWSLWFGSSVLSVLELLELLLDAVALTLLLGWRRLRRAQGGRSGAAPLASHAKPEAHQLPTDCGNDIHPLGVPAGPISPDASWSSG
ncbi:amiloride-sensitive sodium channel subunit delta [Suricata suricatta]|uniref:amiloride-sensitive sodium channel subunit delta n=1 Tax=Suricata suricatta TaxID=37032 RepID=UPI0011558FAD|nr:amiloride-sensitive sodium channel subunit delta [Suricata suricatta]